MNAEQAEQWRQQIRKQTGLEWALQWYEDDAEEGGGYYRFKWGAWEVGVVGDGTYIVELFDEEWVEAWMSTSADLLEAMRVAHGKLVAHIAHFQDLLYAAPLPRSKQ